MGMGTGGNGNVKIFPAHLYTLNHSKVVFGIGEFNCVSTICLRLSPFPYYHGNENLKF